jgi:hypothetical protein
MISALVGTLFGGLFRLAPEILGFFERKDDRKHELALFNLQIEADKLKASQVLQQMDAQVGIEQIKAVIAATKAQSVMTGVKWVDAINSLVRPLITFWWVIVMYTFAMVAEYVALVNGGAQWTGAIMQLWGEPEQALVASIVSFWFVDRSILKAKK